MEELTLSHNTEVPVVYHMAIVMVKPGESNEEAWLRYLKKNPEARGAKIKIFNRHIH